MTDTQGGPPYNPPPYLSASSIGTFRQCPLKFKYNKIDGIPDQPSSATLLGNFVHETLEEFYVLPPEDRNINSARILASKVWASANWEERIRGYVRESDVRQFRWSAWWCLENVFKVEEPPLIDVKGIETEVNGPIGRATVKGFIDRFEITETGVRVSDYKTGKTPKPAWVSDKYMQLQIYATLLNDSGVANVTEIQLLFLKDGVSFKHQLVAEDFERTINYVQDTHDAVQIACETGDFPYKKSKLCDWCAYKSICPGWKK
jgi:putative RecB family exonuclease